MQIADFHGLHSGETCLLVGNAPNLHLTPPEWFNYPSIGVNTIHLYEGFKPTYYVTVDDRVRREFGDAILEKYSDIPKFIPTPNLDAWQGENFYRFYHRAGELYVGGHSPKDKDALKFGLAWSNVMHVAMQLAWHMGFTTLLMVGVQHRPDMMTQHFWGNDDKMPGVQPREIWLEDYQRLCSMMSGVRVLNISEDTYVPEYVLPRGNWRDWRNNESKNA